MTTMQHDFIMVVVDKLTNVAHFISIKMTHKASNTVKIYMKEIVGLYGVSKAIIYDRDTKFISNFWKGLFKGFGTNLSFSIAYHPKSDGKRDDQPNDV
jgi:hypothetical protein